MSLNRKEALKAMANGQIVLHEDNQYQISGFGILQYTNSGNWGQWKTSSGLLGVDGYEIFQEPKKKKIVKLYQYVDADGELTYFGNDTIYWTGTMVRKHTDTSKGTVKTSCFIEVEVEE